MIGLRRNKRGDMVLTIDTYIDIDSTPDIQSDYFDCIYINTTSERAFHAILFGASPILSYKCSYKPIFVNTAVSGKNQITDYIVDAYVSDMSNEKVYEIIDRIKMAKKEVRHQAGNCKTYTAEPALCQHSEISPITRPENHGTPTPGEIIAGIHQPYL